MLMMQKFSDEIRRNRRLQWGLVVILLVMLTDMGARWKERIERKQQTLTQLQIDVSTLKGQAKNEGAMRTALRDARQAAELADARLWVVSSEAVGQARLKDWLIELLKQSGANGYAANVAAPKALVESRPEVPGDNARPPASAGLPLGRDLFDFGATATFIFTPESLEKVLAGIEAGEPLTRVESLSVRRNDRRVEIGIRVLMRLKDSSS
ncbi:MAG: hypothetical protein KF796_06605 [Ramlibacter sp.]|nr:hypothetical protein [Ramlibacter sp.]